MKSRANLLTYRFAVSQLFFIALRKTSCGCDDLRVSQLYHSEGVVLLLEGLLRRREGIAASCRVYAESG
jgi:hypothetical protein